MTNVMGLVLVTLLLLSPHLAAEFKNQSEVSIVSTSGNTDLNVYNGKTTSTYTIGKHVLTVGGHITKGDTNGIESASNWDINARYKRQINKKLGAFYATQYENDNFAGIKYRHNNDLGASYKVIKTDKLTASTEAGYRYRSEKSLAGEVLRQSQGRLYAEAARQNNKSFFTKMWLEYLPNFSESSDWQINVEPSLNFAMNSSLSIKLGYLYRYDNEPVPGLKKYDAQYTTTLIAKF